ncbi:SLC13 family permease [Desulfuromonas sp. CSMB_57]|uniref:SLC13 family permease n=1 Tax=Desulfuromonas sp. CSMB_57 TaxID=2807629 RepID=UPI001CD5B2B0|nr:SLC13 family permease [Desulfuromonas sp. CSMB_57]
MTHEQVLILAVLFVTVVLFLWGRWRHDVVATASLLACVLLGLVPTAEAFSGFGHPAVITVACVLVMSRGLQITGAVDALAQRIVPAHSGPFLATAALSILGAFLSAFMNNVGAMSLLMPVAIQVAGKNNLAPGKLLMPLAFATILGGMTTLIGTPPNLIVAGFRAETGTGPFAMFDFTPVGLSVAGAGILLVVLAGRWLVPERQGSAGTSFDTGAYLTEVRVTEEGKAAGKTLREVEQILEKTDAQIIGMVRNNFRIFAPNPGRLLLPGDILIIEAEPESLSSALSSLGLKLEEAVPAAVPEEAGEGEQKEGGEPLETAEKENGIAAGGDQQKPGAVHESRKDPETEGAELQELVALPDSGLVGRSASDLRIRTRYGLNLLAVSRRGRRTIRRLRSTQIQPGDVLLMQGSSEALSGFASEFSCVPLAARSVHIPDKRQAGLAMGIMALAVMAASLGLLSAAVSFAFGVLLLVVWRVLPPHKMYESIDWSVIVLLGALIPVAGAMATTGAADVVAHMLLKGIASGNPVLAIVIILVLTMTLSDFMNNAATAAVMCPIAISMASQFKLNPDTYLMAVAIGASCAFLTPIGHQNNTLILGPAGFRFGDYWRLGLPMEIVVVAVAVPMLLMVWPL